jgi:sugar phosphate isomerase/epimerase
MQGVDLAEFTRRVGSALCETHLHDNHGVEDEHLPIGGGSVPWPAVLNALRQVNYHGPITFEQADHGVNARRWRELLRQTDPPQTP